MYFMFSFKFAVTACTAVLFDIDERIIFPEPLSTVHALEHIKDVLNLTIDT